MNPSRSRSLDLDRRFAWHPFTPIDAWLDPDFEPVSIVEAAGSELYAEDGSIYLDGNSSIWTITHGHRHPVLVSALKKQLDTLDHSSFLGLTHPWGGELAEKLSGLAGGGYRVFFSDDGSTAMEAALKMVWQYFQQNGQPQRTRFISLGSGYHGDTIGAMSLGQSGAFHGVFQSLLFPTIELTPPICYRCPYNRSGVQSMEEARRTRVCEMECARDACTVIEQHSRQLAAVVMEPRVQGAAGMQMHPEGYLSQVAAGAQAAGAKLILDEVLTGFGRTGAMLAARKENVSADVIALSKGLTGGALPMGATLVREEIFDGFRGGLERTFYHGHSYTANPLGCAAALANLQIFEDEKTLDRIATLAGHMRSLSARFWRHKQVGDVRQEGLILAVELVRDRASRAPFPAESRVAFRISEGARKFGLLTRGIGNILILMPPYGTNFLQLQSMVTALDTSLEEFFRADPSCA